MVSPFFFLTTAVLSHIAEYHRTFYSVGTAEHSKLQFFATCELSVSAFQVKNRIRVKIQLGNEAWRTQRKFNDHVYSFLLFVSSRPHYQAEFHYIKSGLIIGE